MQIYTFERTYTISYYYKIEAENEDNAWNQLLTTDRENDGMAILHDPISHKILDIETEFKGVEEINEEE